MSLWDDASMAPVPGTTQPNQPLPKRKKKPTTYTKVDNSLEQSLLSSEQNSVSAQVCF